MTMPLERVVVVGECAGTCPLVRMLLIEIARLRGTSEAVQRMTHALDPDPPAAV